MGLVLSTGTGPALQKVTALDMIECIKKGVSGTGVYKGRSPAAGLKKRSEKA